MNRPLVTACAADAGTNFSPSCSAQTEADRLAAIALTALTELDEWAMNATTRPGGLGLALSVDKISPERRANYCAYMRLQMAIQQIETALVIKDAVKHPKAPDITMALKVWANKALAAAEPECPDAQRGFYNTKKD